MTGAAETQWGHFCDKFFKNAEEWVFNAARERLYIKDGHIFQFSNQCEGASNPFLLCKKHITCYSSVLNKHFADGLNFQF